MPVTNPPEPDTTTPPTQSDWESLNYLVVNLIEAAFRGDVTVVTTDRTGKVDAAWREVTPDGATAPELIPVDQQPWLATAPDETRDFALRNLGGMLRLYATHPDRSDLVTVTTYDDWPAMVEVRLAE